MSDVFEAFSKVLHWPKAAVKDYQEWYDQARAADEEEGSPDEPRVTWECYTQGDKMHLVSEDFFDAEKLAGSIRTILEKYDLPPVGISWSRETSWGEERGGGALWVRAHGDYSLFDTFTWLKQMALEDGHE